MAKVKMSIPKISAPFVRKGIVRTSLDKRHEKDRFLAYSTKKAVLGIAPVKQHKAHELSMISCYLNDSKELLL